MKTSLVTHTPGDRGPGGPGWVEASQPEPSSLPSQGTAPLAFPCGPGAVTVPLCPPQDGGALPAHVRPDGHLFLHSGLLRTLVSTSCRPAQAWLSSLLSLNYLSIWLSDVLTWHRRVSAKRLPPPQSPSWKQLLISSFLHILLELFYA